MKIIQLLPTIAFGDAVSNDTRAIRKIIEEMGFETEIYAEHIDVRLPKGTARSVGRLSRLQDDDILIYHGSTGTELNFDLPNYGGRQVMIYHNITPPVFFHDYAPELERETEYGYKGIRNLADKVAYCVADSDYNRQDLRQMGYNQEIDVCPIIIPFEDYEKKPDQQIINKYMDDGWTNALFVGRLAPNKKEEDVIRSFFCYQRDYNPKSRLFLVGGGDGGMYERRLRNYVQYLGISDRVILTGHIKFDAILAYYTLADVFVCMSEHEGFCVPLAEAMFFDTPIVAYRSSAVPETLGQGGMLLDEKDPNLVAAVIDRIVRDEGLRAYLSKAQKARLAQLQYGIVKEKMQACIKKMLQIQR